MKASFPLFALEVPSLFINKIEKVQVDLPSNQIERQWIGVLKAIFIFIGKQLRRTSSQLIRLLKSDLDGLLATLINLPAVNQDM